MRRIRRRRVVPELIVAAGAVCFVGLFIVAMGKYR